MRVVYKKKVLDKILDEVRKAETQRRGIRFILLTPNEYDELRYEVTPHLCSFRPYDHPDNPCASYKTLALRDPVSGRTYSYALQDMMVCGVEVVRVSPEHINWEII